MNKPIVKIVPIPSTKEGGRTFYKIEIPQQQSLLNEKETQEFITYLQEAIEVVRTANNK